MYEQKTELAKMAQQCREDSKRWFGDTSGDDLAHFALALGGEVGEFQNIIKKIDRGSLSLRDPKVKVELAGEIADIFTYLLVLAAMLNVDLETAYKVKRTYNDQRFTAERLRREANHA